MADPYLTPAQLRERVEILKTLAVPDEVLVELVDEFEGLAERYRGVAFTPREAVAHVAGTGRRGLVLPHQEVTDVEAIASAWGAEEPDPFTVDELAEVLVDGKAGILRRPGGWHRGYTYVVTYTHGHTAPPAAVLRACREWVRAKAIDAGVQDGPRNAIAYQDPNTGWSYRDSTADWDAGRPTGLMVVDDALNTLPDRRTPAIG